jgi:hypothetical protein
MTNGHNAPEVTATISGAHGNTDVADDAANAAGESQWDTGNEMTTSQEWVDVKVPREPGETETGITATPAAPSNTQSWADDHPETAEAAPAAAADDGFQSVQGRNRGNREGGHRGRGGYRGRGGFRGEGRGRGGRGGPRGGMPSRPRRGGEEN